MTTNHLLLVTLGPVQDFIAQTRRTRDLWHSSHLLSELGRAAARSLAEEGATLLIPALDAGSSELEPCWGFSRDGGQASTDDANDSPFAIANKIYAEVPAHLDPATLAFAAREYVQAFLRKHAKWVWDNVEDLLASNTHGAWNEQVDSLLEFAAGWLPLDFGFDQVRAKLDNAVSARKQLRDFDRWHAQRGWVPKSSLDGVRDTVLPDKPSRKAALGRVHGVGEQEQLDAIGMIKRAGGKPERFTPIINVALAAWLRKADRTALQACIDLCSKHRPLIQEITRPIECSKCFPFEASVLLPTRWPSLEREKGFAVPQELRSAVRQLHEANPMPDEPYVACLVADGDHMGNVIQAIASPTDLRRFSGKLSEFAKRARDVVERDHFGSLVYAGGDDVLAFLPVAHALECAHALSTLFTATVSDALNELEVMAVATTPTLSVGIGIGHYMESMGQLRAIGHDAERLAKQTRNTLAVIVDKRSGGRRQWASAWNAEVGPIERLRGDIELFAAGLSTRKVHEIAATLERLPRADHEKFMDVLSGEVRRSLARVNLGVVADNEPSAYGLDLDGAKTYAERRILVRDWIDRLLIARELSGGKE